MQVEDTGLKAAIKNASTLVQETASKSEAAVLSAVERVEASVAGVQSKFNDARALGSEFVDTLGHAGRTSYQGVVEFNGALGRYSKDALTDTVELGRQSFNAKSVKEIIDLNLAFLAKRGQAMFASVNELNAIAHAKSTAAWMPLGETLRKAGEKATVQASS